MLRAAPQAAPRADRFDVAIIGAGMSGLAAGIRAAYYEQRVCLLERHTTIGGLNSFYRLAGRNYDVGLHAVTNFAPKGSKRGPLPKLLRQLRIDWDDFDLAPQAGSLIAFPDVSLRFSNEFELLESEVRRCFPREAQRFRELTESLIDYDELNHPRARESARAEVARHLRDPLLAEMLFCPLMFYGNPRPHDMEFGQFSVLFRSILSEGFGRPRQGVRRILKHLVRKFKSLGGDLRLRSGVSRLAVEDGRVQAIVLDDGNEITADRVLSSAGWVETMKLCDGATDSTVGEPGQLSFVESISVLDDQPRDLGVECAVVFYNDSPKFHWQRPDELMDVRSGVICSPNNYGYDEPLPEGVVRVTSLADFDRWRALAPDEYQAAKRRGYEQQVASAVRFVPDFRPAVVATDVFTPTTIRRYTGHENGAVYGAPRKQWDGTTHLENLFVCGTDQGWLGIVGAMISGAAMANQHLLRTGPRGAAIV